MKRLAAVTSGALALGLLMAAVVYAQTPEPTAASGWSLADAISVATAIIQVFFLGAGTFIFVQWRQSTKETHEGHIALLKERLSSTDKNHDEYKLLADERLALREEQKDDAERKLGEMMAGREPQATPASGPVALDPAVKEGIQEVLRRLEKTEKNRDDYKLLADERLAFLKDQKDDAERKLSEAMQRAGIEPQATLASGPVVLDPALKEDIQEVLRRLEKLETVVKAPQVAPPRETAAPEVAPRRKIVAAAEHLMRGQAHFFVGEYQAAIEAYSQAIELRPNYAQAYYHRGGAFSYLEQYPRAIEDFDRAIQLKPDYADAFLNRGYTYHSLGQYPRAIEDYDRAIQLQPDDADAYHNRGYAYHTLGQYPRAIEDYDKAIELQPDFAMAYSNRGAVHIKLSEYELAIRDCNKAIEVKPDYAGAYYNRACAYSMQNLLQEALADLEKAISLDNKCIELAHTDKDKDFDNIREDPRFRKLVGLA